MTRFTQLEQWLAWQASLNPREIDLGLDRLRRISGVPKPSCQVITVAGTNGKGSSVAFLVSMLEHAGYRVGAYTSPHLMRYNERIRIDGASVSDAVLCEAFHWVDRTRGEIPLTFFEFGTLAALRVFDIRTPDVVVLEVGLGGRLDAVNLVDADVALITQIGLDHTEWLGPDRDAIGREKAGILRTHRPAVIGDPDPPGSVLQVAEAVDARVYSAGQDFGYRAGASDWTWWGPGENGLRLPMPALAGAHQLANAAAALMALRLTALAVQPGPGEIARALTDIQLPGRYQRIAGAVEHLLDVTHNADGARALAQQLEHDPVPGRTIAVAGLLRDKCAHAVFTAIWSQVDRWHLAPTVGERGQPAEALVQAMPDPGRAKLHASAEEALEDADQTAKPGDRVLVLGSFQMVECALRRYASRLDCD